MHPQGSILRKGAILISIPFVLYLLFFIFFSELKRQGEENQELASHSDQLSIQAELIFRNIVDMQSSMRGYIITQDPDFTAPYHNSLRDLPQHLQKLEELGGSRPDLKSSVMNITVTAQKFVEYSNKNLQLISDGRHAESVERVKSAEGKNLVDELRQQVDRLVSGERILAAQRQKALNRSFEIMGQLLTWGIAASLLVTALLFLAFINGITARLAVLSENVERFRQGKPLVAPASGNDELTQVDHAFHEMAKVLTESAEKERTYKLELEDRAVKLTEAYKELEDKSKENEMFVYSVSHDLRSPLVNLQGFSKELGLISQDLRTLLDSKEIPPAIRDRGVQMIDRDVKESLHFIQNGVVRLANIIEALLRLSRAGRVEYRMQDVDLKQVIQNIVESLKNTIQERGAEIYFMDLPHVWGDRTAIEQIFGNLIGNALHYLDPSRKGKIEIGCKDCSDLSNGGPKLHTIYVRDNGIGIPVHYQTKVFQMFQRLNPESTKGEGVGLTLVKLMVERHGGNAWIESQPGEGTTFFISLPRVPEELPEEQREQGANGNLRNWKEEEALV